MEKKMPHITNTIIELQGEPGCDTLTEDQNWNEGRYNQTGVSS